jgi:hypothetical protein
VPGPATFVSARDGAGLGLPLAGIFWERKWGSAESGNEQRQRVIGGGGSDLRPPDRAEVDGFGAGRLALSGKAEADAAFGFVV